MKELIEKFETLENLVSEAKTDFTKFTEKNNKTAGTRVRKAMMEIKKVAQEVRVRIQDIKNAE